jgi:hypothetical protein
VTVRFPADENLETDIIHGNYVGEPAINIVNVKKKRSSAASNSLLSRIAF